MIHKITFTPIGGYIRSTVGDGNRVPADGVVVVDELPVILKLKSRRTAVILIAPLCLFDSAIKNRNDSIAFLDCKSICVFSSKMVRIYNGKPI